MIPVPMSLYLPEIELLRDAFADLLKGNRTDYDRVYVVERLAYFNVALSQYRDAWRRW